MTFSVIICCALLCTVVGQLRESVRCISCDGSRVFEFIGTNVVLCIGFEKYVGHDDWRIRDQETNLLSPQAHSRQMFLIRIVAVPASPSWLVRFIWQRGYGRRCAHPRHREKLWEPQAPFSYDATTKVSIACVAMPIQHAVRHANSARSTIQNLGRPTVYRKRKCSLCIFSNALWRWPPLARYYAAATTWSGPMTT